MTNGALLVNQRETTREEGDRGVIHRPRTSPRVCWPTEHLTAVFDDVLVAVWVLDSVLSGPGSFDLHERKTELKGLMNGFANKKPNQHPSLQGYVFARLIQKQTSIFRRYSHRTALTSLQILFSDSRFELTGPNEQNEHSLLFPFLKKCI